MPTIAHISDLHLQSGVPARQAQVEPILKKINAMKPDLVVISGDVTDDGWDSIDELKWAKDWLDQRIDSDWFAVPGNHDVGNFISLQDASITEERVVRWSKFFRFKHAHHFKNWQVLGINSMLHGTGFDSEYEQLKWLDFNFNAADRHGVYTACFLHSPLFVSHIDEADEKETSYWLGARSARQTLWQRIQGALLIGSGHIHHTNLQKIERKNVTDTTLAWAPPASGTWVHAPGLPNPPMPVKTGFFLHTLHDDGRVDTELIECAPMLKLVAFDPTA